MRTFMITFALGAVGAVTGCLAACSTPGSPRSAATPTARYCLTSTGSRIAAVNGSCSGIGQVYTADDIAKTGATTAGDALRLLSPSVTIDH